MHFELGGQNVPGLWQCLQPHYLLMITRLVLSQRRSFTLISKQPDYYSILGVDRGASQADLLKAYKLKTRQLVPQEQKLDNPALAVLRQAFAILNNARSRQAYDYLNQIHKVTTLPTQDPKPVELSPNLKAFSDKIATYRAKKNLDEFGRYKGGLPQERGRARGTAIGNPGQFHDPTEDNYENSSAQPLQRVTPHDATQFGHWYNEERVLRERNFPTFKVQINYSFFRLLKLRKSLGYLRDFLLVFVLLPGLYYQMRSAYYKFGLQK